MAYNVHMSCRTCRNVFSALVILCIVSLLNSMAIGAFAPKHNKMMLPQHRNPKIYFPKIIIPIFYTVSMVSLNAKKADNELDTGNSINNDGGGQRREVIGTWLRKALVLGLGFKSTTIATTASASQTGDMDAVNGRIVTFEVQNLNGVDGQTGTVKVQMAPTWAPRGVARFEVR
jgi:hypothetical protein